MHIYGWVSKRMDDNRRSWKGISKLALVVLVGAGWIVYGTTALYRPGSGKGMAAMVVDKGESTRRI